MTAFFGLSAFLAAFAFLAGAAEDFVAVVVDASAPSVAVATADFAAVPAAGFDAAVRAAAGCAAVPADLVRVVVVGAWRPSWPTVPWPRR